MSRQETIKKSAWALLACICLFTKVATAQPGGDERRGPPPEAYEACAELSAGASCEVTGRRGDTLQGTCIVPKEDDDSLVCAPEGGPGRGSQSGGPVQ